MSEGMALYGQLSTNHREHAACNVTLTDVDSPLWACTTDQQLDQPGFIAITEGVWRVAKIVVARGCSWLHFSPESENIKAHGDARLKARGCLPQCGALDFYNAALVLLYAALWISITQRLSCSMRHFRFL